MRAAPDTEAVSAIAAVSRNKDLVPGPLTGVVTTAIKKGVFLLKACVKSDVPQRISGVVLHPCKNGWVGDVECVVVHIGHLQQDHPCYPHDGNSFCPTS